MSDEVYAPNQQYVRPDRSGPAEEGEGGSNPATEPDPKPATEPEPASEAEQLDALTKDQLLAYAAEHGVEADASMTKAEIRASIDAAGGAG